MSEPNYYGLFRGSELFHNSIGRPMIFSDKADAEIAGQCYDCAIKQVVIVVVEIDGRTDMPAISFDVPSISVISPPSRSDDENG